jgi:aminoglycoside phosphotransferase (APT) family kinase protein
MAAINSGAPPPAELPRDTEIVRRLLEEQHPELASLSVVLAAEGWDNVTFRLGDELAVRLPRRAVAANLVVNEQRWLPDLASRLSLRVPTPTHMGVPSDDFPWHWSVVPWIPGTSALETPLLSGEAPRLGRFLEQLHSIEVPGDAPHNPYRGGPLGPRHAGAIERLERLRPTLRDCCDVDQLAAGLAIANEVPIDTEPVWLHGDLHAKNIVSAQGRIAAVIDWGDICAGDPATDLASVWNLFELSAHARFWEDYGEVSRPTRQRAAGWAITFGLMLWDSHHGADPAFAKLGLTTLSRVAASPL